LSHTAAEPNSDPKLIPLKPDEARRLAREIVENGFFDFSGHAIKEMEKDGLEATDCLNALRGGAYDPPEEEKGELRYRVHTNRMRVVFTFRSVERLRVVTAWRKR
jgi:hypothetical protein